MDPVLGEEFLPSAILFSSAVAFRRRDGATGRHQYINATGPLNIADADSIAID
jgi:hypothetical protein